MAIFARLLRGRVRITKIAATALARAHHRSMRPLAFYLQRFLSIPSYRTEPFPTRTQPAASAFPGLHGRRTRHTLSQGLTLTERS